MFRNEVTERLQMERPIIQAPMAGGVTTSSLVTAVSHAGGLGMIGAGYMHPDQVSEQIKAIKKETSRFFGINLFVPNEFTINDQEIAAAKQWLSPYYKKFNLQEEVEIPKFSQLVSTFEQHIKVVIEEKVPVCSFTFGIPSKKIIEDLKQHGTVLIGTATTVEEAIANEKSGMDIIVVQGSEAGGHRGNFLGRHQASQIGLMSLIPQVVDHVSIPVIAAGGIMDGRGLMASICLGAQAVQMGTAFLTCDESGANEIHKEAVLQAQEDQTVFTRSFSGKWARGIKNTFISEMQGQEANLPSFPIQNTLTKGMRKAASMQNNRAYMSLWSGQSPMLAKKQTVQSLIQSVMEEAIRINGQKG